MRLMLILLSAWVAIGQLQMFKLRNIRCAFYSAIGTPSSRAVEGVLSGLVLTSTCTFIHHSQLLFRCNLTFYRFNLLIRGLLRLTRHYTGLFQLTLLNGADHWVDIGASRALQMIILQRWVIGSCRIHRWCFLWLQLLLLLLPGFKHMYLILLYFLNVLNLLLLQILHLYRRLGNLLFGSICSILTWSFWLLKFIDVHIVMVGVSWWNNLLLVHVLWTLVQILLNQFGFWNAARSCSRLLLRRVPRVAMAIISTDGLALFHVLVLITKRLESFRLPLIGRAISYARLRYLVIDHGLVSVCRFLLLLGGSLICIDVNVDYLL